MLLILLYNMFEQQTIYIFIICANFLLTYQLNLDKLELSLCLCIQKAALFGAAFPFLPLPTIIYSVRGHPIRAGRGLARGICLVCEQLFIFYISQP